MAFGKPNVIKKRVMAVIESRIQAAETSFQERSSEIDRDAEIQVQQVYRKADEDKDTLADTLVNGILGKVL